MLKTFLSNSLEDTKKLGKSIAQSILSNKSKCIITLSGNLGTGKTALSCSIIQTLSNTSRNVTSPTFTVVNEYNDNDINICHIDLYRIRESDWETYDLDHYIDNADVSLIEWSEICKEITDRISDIHITIDIDNNKTRNIVIADKSKKINIL